MGKFPVWTGTANSSRAPEFTPDCGSYCSIFSFLCSVLQIIVCPVAHWMNIFFIHWMTIFSYVSAKERTLCPVKGCKFSAVEKINVKNHVFNMHTNKVKH
jgi:hypothetical protein